MATLSQRLRKSPPRRKYQQPSKVTYSQERGVVRKIFTASPKKPNSGERAVCKVMTRRGKVITCQITGIGHSLIEHATVLFRNARVKDRPGVNHRIIRGALDCSGVKGRVSSRSKYGVVKPQAKD